MGNYYDEETGKTSEKTCSLQLVKELAQQALLPEAIDICDPRTKYFRIGNDVKEFTVPPPLRNHRIQVLDDLINYVKEIEETPVTVWHNESQIVVLIDDEDRRDTVTMLLKTSKQLETLKMLEEKRPPLTQKGLLFMLRYELGFRNTLIINQFRKLDWVNSSTDSSAVNFANSKLGKSIVSEVAGVESLPEEIQISVPVYDNYGENQEYTVTAGVEIDTFNHSFQLIPMPNEINRVIDIAQQSIRSRLANGLKEVGLYYGKP